MIAAVLVFWYFYFKPGTPYVMPIFNTQTELDASPWGDYIEEVYKNKPTGVSSDYPVDLTEFGVLYKTHLNNNGIYIPQNTITNACSNLTVNNVPSTILSTWTQHDDPKYWLNKLKPFNCLPDDTYTEVVHAGGDPPWYRNMDVRCEGQWDMV
jgi:hypothetical protein